MSAGRIRIAAGLVAGVALLAGATAAHAAPCCGGNPALPSLIVGDDRAQLGLSVGRAEVVGDAPVSGIPVFRAAGDDERTESLRVDAAYRFADDWQASIGVPLLRRSRALVPGAANTGVGDVDAGVAWEAWPELTYSAWKPRALVFAHAVLPTGPSVYDASDAFLLEARGRGFYSIGGGVALLKSWRAFDFSLVADLHRSLARDLTAADGSQLALGASWGGTAIAGIGYSPGMGPWRIGASVGPAYEGGAGVGGDLSSSSAAQLVWNASLQLAWLFARDASASMTYVDQTLVGPASNVTLSRALALTLQKRWEL